MSALGSSAPENLPSLAAHELAVRPSLPAAFEVDLGEHVVQVQAELQGAAR